MKFKYEISTLKVDQIVCEGCLAHELDGCELIQDITGINCREKSIIFVRKNTLAEFTCYKCLMAHDNSEQVESCCK